MWGRQRQFGGMYPGMGVGYAACNFPTVTRGYAPPSAPAPVPAPRQGLLSREELKPVFDKYDTNSDGCVDREELGSMMAAFGLNFYCTDTALNEILATMDCHDSNGTVDFDEFVEWYGSPNGPGGQSARAKNSRAAAASGVSSAFDHILEQGTAGSAHFGRPQMHQYATPPYAFSSYQQHMDSRPYGGASQSSYFGQQMPAASQYAWHQRPQPAAAAAPPPQMSAREKELSEARWRSIAPHPFEFRKEWPRYVNACRGYDRYSH